MTVFLLILNQMEIHLVQNRKENCRHDHNPFNVKGNGNIVFLVCIHRTALNAATEPNKISNENTLFRLICAPNRIRFGVKSVGKSVFTIKIRFD